MKEGWRFWAALAVYTCKDSWGVVALIPTLELSSEACVLVCRVYGAAMAKVFLDEWSAFCSHFDGSRFAASQ